MIVALREQAATDRDNKVARGVWPKPKVPCTLSVVAESRTPEPLGRSPGSEGANRARARSPGRFTFPGPWAEWLSKRRAFTHSGGTAPDLHRTSPLCLRWHPRQAAMLAH